MAIAFTKISLRHFCSSVCILPVQVSTVAQFIIDVANLPVCGQGCQSGALLSSVVVVKIRIWDDRERRKVNVKAI